MVERGVGAEVGDAVGVGKNFGDYSAVPPAHCAERKIEQTRRGNHNTEAQAAGGMLLCVVYDLPVCWSRCSDGAVVFAGSVGHFFILSSAVCCCWTVDRDQCSTDMHETQSSMLYSRELLCECHHWEEVNHIWSGTAVCGIFSRLLSSIIDSSTRQQHTIDATLLAPR